MDPRFRYRRHKSSAQEQKKDQETERERLQRTRGMSFALVIPAYLAFGPVSGWLLGSWLDKRMDTDFWLPTLVVAMTIVSFVMVIRLMASVNK